MADKMIEVVIRVEENTHKMLKEHAKRCGVSVKKFVQVAMYVEMIRMKNVHPQEQDSDSG